MWITWHVFQSKESKEICDHLPPVETCVAGAFWGAYGLCGGLAITLCWYGLGWLGERVLLTPLIVFTGAVGLVVLQTAEWFFWVRLYKRFLCSTKWAKSQGYSPATLRISDL